MTRTATRLAALDAISRERSLTDDEASEVKRLAHLERQCARRRQRYASDPSFRQTMLDRIYAWRRRNGVLPMAESAKLRPRDEQGRFA